MFSLILLVAFVGLVLYVDLVDSAEHDRSVDGKDPMDRFP
jgi:hypothetical protein